MLYNVNQRNDVTQFDGSIRQSEWLIQNTKIDKHVG